MLRTLRHCTIRHHMGTIVALMLFSSSALAQVQFCPDEAVTFALTECDEANGLWRVAVPVNESDHCIPTGNPPLRINSCENVCPAGHSYNLKTLNCTLCAAGTYSVGNSQTYEDWQELPSGFLSESVPLHQPGQSSEILGETDQPSRKGSVSCSERKWLPRGDYITLEESENCVTRLSLEVEVVEEAGFVEFEYQFPDSSLMFVFNIDPKDCGATGKHTADGMSEDGRRFRIILDQTSRNSWLTRKVHLQKGRQTLAWMGLSLASSQSSNYKPIRVRRVEVAGVKYTNTCTLCPAGTYSSPGASRCEDCQLDHVSGRGSGTCSVCPAHQYALPGFLKCFDRSPCTASDYIRRVGPCSDGMAELTYEWIQPKICLDAEGIIPPPSSKIQCPQCNRGTYRVNATDCGVCELGQFVNGQGKCQICDSGTNPAYKYEVVNWDYYPYNNMDAFCWNSSAMGCAESGGWQQNGGSFSSGIGHEDNVLSVLQMFTGGFRKVIAQGLYGKLAFDFDMLCKSLFCEMQFITEDTNSYGSNTIKTWTGPQPRQRYEYLITQNTSLAFTWAFIKTVMPTNEGITRPRLFGHDVFRLYSVNITNTIDGGADSCEPCTGSDPLCRRCGTNEIWNTDLKKCTSCPANSVVSDIDGTCVQCGPNLVASGKVCVSNCKVSLRNGRKQYDLTALKGFHQASTQHFFEIGGEENFHVYNISFCQDTPAICSNSLRRGSTVAKSTVKAFVCRSTHLTDRDGTNATTSVQAFAAGQELMGVTEEAVKETSPVGNLFSEIQSEFSEKLAPDFFYRFQSQTATSACKSGRSTVIKMRCSKNTTSMHDIRVPSKCPGGTCDGCTYRLMWLTPFACPICGVDDYTIVRGECSGGQQSIYYHAKPHCHETNSTDALVKQIPCRSVPFSVQVLIISLVVSGVALTILVFILYKNANKYKHRYMKLVQDASGVIHLQLPESCVDDHELDENDDGRDDEDDKTDHGGNFNVEFRTPSETVYAKVKKAVTRKKDLQRSSRPVGGRFQESEENELLTE